MYRFFIADVDAENASVLRALLEELNQEAPIIWQGKRSFHQFIQSREEGVLFIRIDSPRLEGGKLTKEVADRGGPHKVVWMARGEGFVMEAFTQSVDEYLVLPPTKTDLCRVLDNLYYKRTRYG